MEKNKISKIRITFLCLVCLVLLVAPMGALAKEGNPDPWWEVEPEEETPAPQYDSILYSEIAPRLHEIEENSNRVKVEVIGQSAGGRDLYLVTLSDPQAMGRLGVYQAIRNTMLKDPEKAQEMIDRFGDFKVPVFINASIHGDEYPGVDAAIRLIETLAYEDTEEVQAILENIILLVNVVQNPDGRVMGTRSNANGFDINRDFVTQSQPETLATVKIFTEWNPMVTLDLHGFVSPMLIEPCTPPHNPNFEYDLYIQWAYNEALAMEDELLAQTGLAAQIPFRDDRDGWDDWAPSYVPMYGMFHGSYGHTLETPYRDERGVDAHFAAVWGALKFVAENREAMVYDQIEIFRRGFLDLPQMLIPDEILDETRWDQFNELTIKEFPVAYVIPPDIPLDIPIQYSDHQVARLVDFLLYNDVQVEQASQSFSIDEVEYPNGSYIVWMDQPKRGLANTLLESGPDLSDIEGLTFYSPPSTWSHPYLWGVKRVIVDDEINDPIPTIEVKQADPPTGTNPGGDIVAYLPTSLAAFQATNDLLNRDEDVYYDAGQFIISGEAVANELANRYALDLETLEELPGSAVILTQPRIAVSADEGTRHALGKLGFSFDELTHSDLNAGAIADYDVYINYTQSWTPLNHSGELAMADWIAAGGDYIGLSGNSSDQGVAFAIEAGFIDVDYVSNSGNAIVSLDYNSDNPLSSGFWLSGNENYAFVANPLWFTRLGDGVDWVANYGAVNFLVSGYWPGWQTSGAAGMPAVVTKASDSSDVTLIGVDNTFRGHPEDTFRLLGNAIFSGID